MLEGKFLDKHNFSLDDNTLWPYLDNMEEDDPVSISSNTYCDKSYGGRHPRSDCNLHSSSNCSSHRSPDFTASRVIYTAGPALNIPLNLTLSKRFMDSFKFHRRTRSTNYYGNPLQYASAFSQTKLIISPSEKWIYNSMNSDEKERKPSKDSAIFNLAGLKGQEIELSTLTKSPSSLGHISLDKICEGYNIGRRRSASKISDLTFVSSKSTCSYQSELSEYDVVSKGLLRHTWNDGLPYFEFSLTDEHGEAYIANAWKVNSLHDKALDYIYTFCARTRKRKGSSLNNSYRVIGQMKVSSCLSFSSDKSKLVETEFVLFDASDNTKDLMCSSSGMSRSKGLPERMLNVFRQTEINFQTSSRYNVANFEYGKLSEEPGVDDSSLLVETFPSGYFKNCFRPNLEMAAIVVKEHQHTERAEKAAGGWGLKFLEKPDDITGDQSHEPPFLPEPVRAGDEFSRSMVVLIPAGSHGGPSTTVGGPSSLTERWRTGGHCDCGGWDIGCPLTVLKDQSTCSTASPVESSQEDLASVNFIVEGTKQGEPAALRVMALNEGLHAISFQSKLSALQAFSVGVAMIHSQAPALRAEF